MGEPAECAELTKDLEAAMNDDGASSTSHPSSIHESPSLSVSPSPVVGISGFGAKRARESSDDDDCDSSIKTEATVVTSTMSSKVGSNSDTAAGSSSSSMTEASEEIQSDSKSTATCEPEKRRRGGRKPKRGRKPKQTQSVNTPPLPKLPGGQQVSRNTKYKYSCTAREDHGTPVYGCAFLENFNDDGQPVFATVGSNRVTVYKCEEDGSVKVIQCFEDPDPTEVFYACAWSNDDSGKTVLAAGGLRGVIRIFEPSTASYLKHYVGHGEAINDVMFHPKDGNLLLSTSKDFSLRLWNIKTDILVAIFGGGSGHRDEVIAADIDITGSRLVSCGMDSSLKIWTLNKPDIESTIQQSYTHSSNSFIPFPTKKVCFPDFSTVEIHSNCVDSVKWFGDSILSKSVENEVVLWRPHQDLDNLSHRRKLVMVQARLKITDCKVWFMRFCLDSRRETLAVGNKSGTIFIYDLNVPDVNEVQANCTVLVHSNCLRAIRQVAFSTDGSVLIGVCDDATIWRWDLRKLDANDSGVGLKLESEIA